LSEFQGVRTGSAIFRARGFCRPRRGRRVVDLKGHAQMTGDPVADLHVVDELGVRWISELQRRSAGLQNREAAAW